MKHMSRGGMTPNMPSALYQQRRPRYTSTSKLFPSNRFKKYESTFETRPNGTLSFQKQLMFMKCKVRIVNTLTHQSDTLEVPVEETVEEIQNRYIDF